MIRTFLYQSHRLCFKTTIMPSPDLYWSLINIDQYWSGLFFTKVTDSVSKQLLCRVLIYIDQYWSILINIDQYWSGLFFTKVTDSVSKQLLCRVLYRSILINIDQYWSILRTFLYQSHRLCFKTTIMPSPDLYRSINIDQYWSILINIDQDFSLPKSQTLFQNNYYAESWSIYWSILINIDQYWSGLFFTKVTDSVSKQLLCRVLIYIDQYWSILINIDQDFSILINIDQELPKSQTLFQNNYYAESWSILINIDQYWSILIRTFLYQSHRLCFKTTIMPSPDLYAILINIDQSWSILIRTFLYQSHRLCFKTTIMPSPDLYWSILINIDQYFSLPKSQTLFQNNYYGDLFFRSILINIDQYWDQIRLFFTKTRLCFIYAESWSILINIDQYWSILIRTFLYQSPDSDSVSKQLLCRVCFKTTIMPILIYIDQWSILINIDQDFSLPKPQTLFQNNYYAESWSILINIDQYWSILIRTFLYQSQRLCFKTTIMPSPDLYRSILINIDQYWSILIFFTKPQTLFQNNYYAESWSILINIDQY